MKNFTIKRLTYEFIRSGVDQPERTEWTVQGFGMLRTYLDASKRLRLNVWDQSVATPLVSTIHDHPWHFSSLIIVGQMLNVKFKKLAHVPANKRGMQIVTGEDGGPHSEAFDCHLTEAERSLHRAGETYEQRATEIHETIPMDGTVSINDRVPVGTGSFASTYWPIGTEWVDAKPRPATPEEVFRVLSGSLNKWQQDWAA